MVEYSRNSQCGAQFSSVLILALKANSRHLNLGSSCIYTPFSFINLNISASQAKVSLKNYVSAWLYNHQIETILQSKGEAGLKCRTRGHSHNCGMYRKENLYSTWKVHMGRGGSKPSIHFLKMMQNVAKI